MDQLVKQVAEGADRSVSLKNLQERLERNAFLRRSWFDSWVPEAQNETAIGVVEWLRRLFFDRSAWKNHRTVRKILADGEGVRSFLNDRIILSVIQANADYFDTVETHPLTKRQREACASDEDSTLIVAGAGTGKTSTILSKIGLLLRSRQCKPEEILAISFTNKSANELAERVSEKLGIEIQISTFHKLGLTILANAAKGKPLLASFAADPIEKAKHLDGIIATLKEAPPFFGKLVEFCAYHRVEPKQLWNFSSLAEYSNWLRSNKIVSLDGVPKKSYQECIIANWLILNGVQFVYEHPYEHDTKTTDRRQYCPDFWLPDAKLYIEHFGIDEKGNTAPFINAGDYKRSMEWKRETHRRLGTNLVETYSWEHEKGILIAKLSDTLRKAGCPLAPISPATALEMMNRNGIISQFSTLTGTFLTLYKGNGNRLLNRGRVDSLFGNRREKTFLELFEKIFAEYQQRNQNLGQIDFEDMIVLATQAAKSGQFNSRYRYILIDEFQDISPGRAELIKAIRSAGPECSLFAVGDDWQSIYRFTGSDIGGMTRFPELFGATRQVDLDTTFRFDNMAVATSSAFVLKNKAQISKQLGTVLQSDEPSLILYRRAAKEGPLDWALSEIANQAKAGASVLILERYKFHLPQEDEWERLSQEFPQLQIEKMSIHAAKGLEADYVVMGLRGGPWGFPSQVIDDPIFDMVLTQADEYLYGEERRLFYVAITRAKRKTILVAETGADTSVFTEELLTDKQYVIRVLGDDSARLRCNKCGSGTMLLRDGSNGQFYGCSNYPLCRNTERTCPKCQKGLLVANQGGSVTCHLCNYQARTCPKCKSGYLQRRNGRFGPFCGCSNYADPDILCGYTDNGNC